MFYIDEGEKLWYLLEKNHIFILIMYRFRLEISVGKKQRCLKRCIESTGICGDSCVHGKSIELWKKGEGEYVEC